MARDAAPARRADTGATLIEMLVVLTLIGVSAAVVTYALPSQSNARSIEQEATLLASRLNIAAERSLVEGTRYRMDWTATGYAFEQWQEGAWTKPSGAPLAQAHDLADVLLTADQTGARTGSIQITPDLLPAADGVIRLKLQAGTASRILSFDGAGTSVAGDTG